MIVRAVLTAILVHSAADDSAALAIASPIELDTSMAMVADEVPLHSLVRLNETSLGRSGALRVAVAGAMEAVNLAVVPRESALHGVTYRWVPLFGTAPEAVGGEAFLASGLVAPSQAGAWRLRLSRSGEHQEIGEIVLLTVVSSTEKRNGRLNGYHIGNYPAAGQRRTDHYAPPTGFIEVTLENRHLPISEHLRLGDFLTKDQFDVWPKYVALDLALIDKLELMMQELKLMGVRAERLHVMSGFRTPQYNGPGGSGRALLSRHTYGDAADVWVESGSRTGYIADLNGDGRRDTRDALVILEAVERVEQRYPELVGGVGVYRENGARGPFVHIDVRGTRSRW